MTLTFDPSLASALEAIAVPGILVGHRLIASGDENALRPEEEYAIASSVTKVKRASGAARIIARQLLARLGHAEVSIPKDSSGVPIWPIGVVGSLSHDASVAVAAVGFQRDIAAVGVDVEPAEPLPPDLLELVTTARERAEIARDPFQGRLLFAAKEAVYKAVYPLDRIFLDHHDVQIGLADQKAIVCNGRIVELRFCVSTHLVTLAYLPKPLGV